ncbi:MAG: prephenate dehydrogenase/arogenate dehydrogenase family protein [Pseudomonadota bacterium]
MSGTLAIVGVGLIGASVARGARRAALADKVIGVDTNAVIAAKALEIGAIDAVASLEDAARAADHLIVATPVGAAAGVLQAIPKDCAGLVVSDVGSVKGAFLEAGAARADLRVVPAHPIAGTEQSGPEAGFAELFHDRWCVLTPLDRRDAPYLKAVETVRAFWAGLGARVETMDAAHHDLALSVTSHLPHLIAFTLVGAADDLETVSEAEIVKYSAGGFRDFTRIAASDPVMWRDVFLANREAVLETLGRFTEELIALQRAVRWGDAETLENAFARGRSLRKAIIDAGQESAAPNFGRDNRGD